MLSISIEAVNARELTMNMAGFASDVSDLSSVWPGVAPVLQAQILEKFSTEGAAGEHGEWAALAPDYAAWKEQHYPGKTILQRDGTLIDSFQIGNGNNVNRQDASSLEFGSKVPYAVYHQWGYAKAFGGGRKRATVGAELERLFTGKGKWAEESASVFEALSDVGSRNVPARRQLDPTDEDINQIRRAMQAGIVNLVRRRGFAIASEAYGPGEMQDIGGGEAFRIGKEGL
jgi:phage gpG-like protein